MSKKKSFFWPILDGEDNKRVDKKPAAQKTAGQASSSPDAEARRAPITPAVPEAVPAPIHHDVPEPLSVPVVPESDPEGASAMAEMPGSSVLANLKSRAQEQTNLQTEVQERAVPSSVAPIFEASGGASDIPVQRPDGLLVLQNVRRSYLQADNELKVLVDANLSVKAGEMVALVAPSGAGKSTLLHIAGLLERPDQGEVYIGGIPQSQAADRARTMTRRGEIGFVYQFHHLLAEFSAVENVMLPQLIRGETKAEAEARSLELLQYLRVNHRASHRPTELSGGEQQRVAIARAMANAPRVLLADEPTGNLDPTTSDYVFKALNALVKQSGIAALVATHNLFLAERMDRQITLVDGKVVEL